jgi:hypothetical protein
MGVKPHNLLNGVSQQGVPRKQRVPQPSSEVSEKNVGCFSLGICAIAFVRFICGLKLFNTALKKRLVRLVLLTFY